MATHEFKICSESFNAIWRCMKHHHEILYDEEYPAGQRVGFEEGDWLLFQEWDLQKDLWMGRGAIGLLTYVNCQPFRGGDVCVIGFQHIHKNTGKPCCVAFDELEGRDRDDLFASPKTFGDFEAWVWKMRGNPERSVK